MKPLLTTLLEIKEEIDHSIWIFSLNVKIAYLTTKMFLVKREFREMIWLRIKIRYLDWKLDLDYTIQSRATGIPIEKLKAMDREALKKMDM